jgi:hypothetical protein
MLEFNSTAANDTLFKHQRHRTSQIVSTVAPIANYPSKLRIYLTDRSTVLVNLGWQFKFIQELAGIEANAMNGKNRTLYSLRHTAITFRLLYGGAIDLLTLARNARTPVDMIEKFYSSNLSAEMNIDLLQGRRR